jgi:hypothetical protein
MRVGERDLGGCCLLGLEVEKALGDGGLLISTILPHNILAIPSDNKIIHCLICELTQGKAY